ncbi:MAG: TIR domain-containing protein [Gammaproteobacteria bacterium]|nr:TIR domain-containing protein [Gammaproteobacteria bacterium]
MAQIFVSHSSKDKELIDILSRAFSSTKVKAIFEEFESILQGSANAPRILKNIAQSNAVFIAIGKNAEALRHTRDWMGFEGGAAAAQANKDIWVLETLSDTDALSFVVPRLQHYVCLDHRDERWQGYLTQIINSYDDSHVIPAIAAGGAAGAARGADGAIIGAGIALVLAALASPTRPAGIQVRCPKCASVYNAHVATTRIRCPVCNTRMLLANPAYKPA